METFSGKTAVITGGAGFIGSHIADALLARGARVKIIDDLSSGRRENVAHLLGEIEFIEDSILNADMLKKAFSGVDFVYHQAALASVPRSVADPLSSHMVNTTGTLQVLLAARDADVKRVIHAASSSYYGDTPTLPKHEGMPPNPISPYGLQKFVAEKYMQLFHTLYGLETVALRYFNIFGPRQNPDSEYAAVIPRFIRMLKNGEAPVVYGDGSASRDFTFIEDAVEANLLAADAPEAAGLVLNIAGGNQYTVNQLLEILQKIIGTRLAPVYGERRQGDIEHSYADISKARKILGYEPKVDFETGLLRTVESFA